MTYAKIDVRPIAGALGADIFGVDLSKPLDNETFAEIHRAYLENLVVFFHDQHITPQQQMAFGRRFGQLDVHPFAKGMDGCPEVLRIVKEADDTAGNFGGTWHSDVTFYEKPALGSVLYAREVPAFGGDTLFANMYLAYESLSDGLKRMLDGLTAVHNASKAYGLKDSRTVRRHGAGSRSMDVRAGADAEIDTEHPVVRTHPETGRRALFVNHVFTQRFKGWTNEESAPLLEFLYRHAVRPEFTCRFRWRKDAIAFWDNRCTQHHAVNDYHGQRREVHRVTVCGDRPFFVADGDGTASAAAAE